MPGDVIRTVLVDDEPPARRKLRHLLSTESDFEMIGEAESAAGASEVLNRLRPDLVFLDIGLPDATGFDVLEAVENRSRLLVVFVTAFDDFALKAFDVHAIDYLVKPVEPSRFLSTAAKIRRIFASEETGQITARLQALLSQVNPHGSFAQRLLIQEGERSIFLEVGRIDWIEAARNYACIHAGGKTHIRRSSLESLGAKLDPKQFRRISRSEIINVNRIAEVRPWFHGDSKVRLIDGTELRWSRRYRPGSLAELER